MWTEKQMNEIRAAMQSGPAFEALLPLAQDMMAREDGKLLIAFALKYFFTHHRMEKAQMRALGGGGEKKLESHEAERVHEKPEKSYEEMRREPSERPKPRAKAPRKPRQEETNGAQAAAPNGAAETAQAPAAPQVPVDRVKLFFEQGQDAGWDSESLAQELSALAGQPREMVLAIEVKPRNAYVVVKPQASDAFLATAGKSLRERPVAIEIAKSSAEREKLRARREPRRREGPESETETEGRVRLYLDQGAEQGWDDGSLAQALSELAGQPRETVLSVELKPRLAYVNIAPAAKDAFLATAGKALKEKPLAIEVARKRR